jgi:hypothetical protein
MSPLPDELPPSSMMKVKVSGYLNVKFAITGDEILQNEAALGFTRDYLAAAV